jgi:cell division protein FtsL
MTVPQRRVESRPTLEVIPGAARKPRHKISHWVLFGIAVVMAFFGLIYSRTSLDHSAFEIQELEAQIAIQEDLHWQLRYELAQIQDPARLEMEIAQLGLEYPAERVALSVPDVDVDQLDPDYRWAQLKEMLSAQP